MKVKICGLTNLEDAVAAAGAGADMLGFNFYPRSPRYIEPAVCKSVVAELRSRGVRALAVGVFVNAREDAVSAIAADCGLDLIQLHGDEPPEMLKALGRHAFKAIRPGSPEEGRAALTRYAVVTGSPALLVDAHRPGAFGGTGVTGDWGLAAELAEACPILLAGGLNPTNVGTAIREVQPWGVDAASGVEISPGRKDREKMLAFVEAARCEGDTPC